MKNTEQSMSSIMLQGHGRIIQISSCGGQVLGSQALASTIATLENRLADFRTQTELASSTDYKE
ncbi:hypothetical protein B0533_04030 [Sedimentibacter sp. SX930]|nr:hypothetical protein B0533_04030 [Sedimentibacter sp. SX930]